MPPFSKGEIIFFIILHSIYEGDRDIWDSNEVGRITKSPSIPPVSSTGQGLYERGKLFISPFTKGETLFFSTLLWGRKLK
jgi:hypothetical protein